MFQRRGAPLQPRDLQLSLLSANTGTANSGAASVNCQHVHSGLRTYSAEYGAPRRKTARVQ